MTAGCHSSVPMRGGACFFTALVALLCANLVTFAANLPALTGRIVDQANVIPADTRNAIETKLADLESKSGIQLVVATVTSLDGEEIEPYANDLFRSWKLGEKAKNNGVLLLVAPKERRVRIEVGYGLEGTLTDALSSVIITNAIVPRFKTGDFGGGIARGVDDIIAVLTTDASEWQQRPSLRLDDRQTTDPLEWLLIAGLIALVTLLIVSPGFRWFFLNVALNLLLNSGGSRGGGGFSSGGGFSGGGGSSGGGGASGNW
jgi:uncharacterized protein